MSSYYKPSGYTDYQKDTQWLNSIQGIHDLYCFCDKPWMHLLESLLQRSNFFDLPKDQARLIQKCLITTATTKETESDHTGEENTTTTKENDGGDLNTEFLEKLFEEDDKNG